MQSKSPVVKALKMKVAFCRSRCNSKESLGSGAEEGSGEEVKGEGGAAVLAAEEAPVAMEEDCSEEDPEDEDEENDQENNATTTTTVTTKHTST